MSFIHVHNLEKRFVVRKKRENGVLLREKEIKHALNGVSFDVEQGELVGYIGPNGAGKSTTVKILSGILTPDGGEALVGGQVPWKNRKNYVRRIGVVFGQRMQLWWDVPILDSYSLLKDIYRIPQDAYKCRLSELIEALSLGDLLHTPLRQMSLGQRMRAELCGSLLHRPEILFLDEPTIGLDAVSKIALRDFLLWENREHRTTIMLQPRYGSRPRKQALRRLAHRPALTVRQNPNRGSLLRFGSYCSPARRSSHDLYRE